MAKAVSVTFPVYARIGEGAEIEVGTVTIDLEAATPAARVHACPATGQGTMPCCGRTPFEVSRGDRVSTDPAAVTCEG